MKRGKKYSEAAKLVDSTNLYRKQLLQSLMRQLKHIFVWALTADMLISRFVVP